MHAHARLTHTVRFTDILLLSDFQSYSYLRMSGHVCFSIVSDEDEVCGRRGWRLVHRELL